MHERYTPNKIMDILQKSQELTTYETKYDLTLLAISFLLETGVAPCSIITAFKMLGYSYGESFVLEGSKYKYKKIRNIYPIDTSWDSSHSLN
jgi:hypothetical protein